MELAVAQTTLFNVSPSYKPTHRRYRICERCGRSFLARKPSGKALRGVVQEGRFCSNKCKGAYRTEAAELKAARLRILKLLSLPRCRVCEQRCSALNRATCSDVCAAELLERRRCKPCRHCGKPYVVCGYGSVFCSAECRIARHKTRIAVTKVKPERIEARRAARRIRRAEGRDPRKYRHRAKKHGVPYEPLNPIDIFERDGWRCQVCGRKTPKRLRGTFKPNAPELDHRIPMALGGGHTWDNCQCACRSCNAWKGGHTAIGQMSLLTQAGV
jgi:hypothetical protein